MRTDNCAMKKREMKLCISPCVWLVLMAHRSAWERMKWSWTVIWVVGNGQSGVCAGKRSPSAEKPPRFRSQGFHVRNPLRQSFRARRWGSGSGLRPWGTHRGRSARLSGGPVGVRGGRPGGRQQRQIRSTSHNYYSATIGRNEYGHPASTLFTRANSSLMSRGMRKLRLTFSLPSWPSSAATSLFCSRNTTLSADSSSVVTR